MANAVRVPTENPSAHELIAAAARRAALQSESVRLLADAAGKAALDQKTVRLLADVGQPQWPGWQMLATLLVAAQLALLINHHDDLARRIRRFETRWRAAEVEVCTGRRALPEAA